MDEFEDDLSSSSKQQQQQQPAHYLQKLKKQKRCLPWNTDVLKDKFTPQLYQIELFKLALNTNLLLFIRSDEYKNYLLIMLMKEYEQILSNFKQATQKTKKIFILVNYQPSITKYHDLLKQHTNLKLQNFNNFNIIHLLKNHAEILSANSIFIINIQLFNEWLNQAYLSVNDILLIIFDDVHNIFYNLNNKHIYENIMLKLSSAASEQPHLVGFGTLILNNNRVMSSIKHLDTNLAYLKTLFKCNIEFASDLLNTQNLLNGVGNTELVEICEHMTHDDFSNSLMSILNDTLVYLNDLNIAEYKRLNQLSSDIDCIYMICLKCVNECVYILNTIGIWCLTKSLLPILCQLDKLTHYLTSTQIQQYEFILLLQYITSKLRLIRELSIKQIISVKHKAATKLEFNDLLISKFSTPKIQTLVSILRSYKATQHQFCCLVYVKNKQVAITLSLLLKKMSKEDSRLNYLSPNYVINNQQLTDESISLDETAISHNNNNANSSSGTDFIKQEEILRKFHSGDINLLICTFDMEEYIDVPQSCNLIVRFDCDYFNYYSYILSKTRLKSTKAENKVAYICEKHQFNEFLSKFKKIKQLEYLFETKYSVLIKRLTAFKHESKATTTTDNDAACVYYPNEANKSVSVNLNNSIELLNRYCIRLPSDALTQLTPNYRLFKNTEQQYKCKLILPINSCLRGVEFQSGWHATMLDAYRHVAFVVCHRLVELNELSQSLEPITKEHFYKQQLNTLFSDKNLINENLKEISEEVKQIDLGATTGRRAQTAKSSKSAKHGAVAQQQQSYRIGSSKRKQMYKRKVSSYLNQSTFDIQHLTYLYRFKCELTTPLGTVPLPAKRTQTEKYFALITQKRLLEIPDYTIFTQYGEDTICVELVKENFYLTANQIKLIKNFHKFLFSYVLRMERPPIVYQSETQGTFICLVTQACDSVDIDWTLMRLVENYNDKSFIKPMVADAAENEENKFEFDENLYTDAVIIPYYRYNDYQPQFYCVQAIDHSLTPLSKFPSNNVLYQTFYDYYSIKYTKTINNLSQPMLVVQHPSTRLNLLTPRYMNLKASVLQKSVFHHKAAEASAENSNTCNMKSNKIYLVPELVNVHPFSCTLWKRCLSLPSILYRLNSLLICEELRRDIAQSTNVGLPWVENDFKFDMLQFNWDFKKEIEISNVPDLEVDINSKLSNGGGGNDAGSLNNNQADDGWNFEISEWNPTTSIPPVFTATNGHSKHHHQAGGEHKNGWFENFDQNKTLFLDTNDIEMFEEEYYAREEENTSWRYDNSEFEEEEDDGARKQQQQNDGENKPSRAAQNGSLDNSKFTINFNNLKADLKRKSAKLLSKLNVSNKEFKNFFVTNDSNEVVDAGEDVGEDTNDDLIKFFNETQLMYLKSNDSNKTGANVNGTTQNLCDAVDLNQQDMLAEVEDDELGNWLANVEIKPKIDEVDAVKAKLATLVPQLDNQEDLFNFEDNFIEKLNTYFKLNENTQVNTAKEAPSGITNQVALNQKFDFNLDYDHDDEKVIQSGDSDDEDDDSALQNKGPGPALLLQALTLSNASDGFNLERLETIGDSFLKQAITVYLFSIYTNVNEGKLSYLRSKQVSNFNLYKLGKRRNIHEIIHANKFEPFDTWLPPHYDAAYSNSLTLDQLFANAFQKMAAKASGTSGTAPTTTPTPSAPVAPSKQFDKFKMHVVSDKSIADSVEAIIGAYLIKSGPKAALRVMYWFGLQVLPKVKLDDGSEVHIDLAIPCKPDINNYNKLNFLLNGYENFEAIIGYKFKTRGYLLQAFTHASYAPNDVTDCYQRLEFLGDAILDYVITRHLYEDPKRHSPGELTDLRSALVNNNIFSYLAVKYEFYKYFKYTSPQLFLIIDNFIKNYKRFNDDDLDENFLFNYSSDGDDEDEDDFEFADTASPAATAADQSQGDENEFEELEVPKVLGDIFESVAGAIFLDSNKSLETVWKVYYTLMKPYIEKYTTKVPKSPIRELLELEPETAKFEKPARTIDGKIRVTVNVFGKGKFKGIGRNYRIAKNAAAKVALKFIRKQE